MASSSFDLLPQSIITSSILQFLQSRDWLSFRLASRSCYVAVHGTSDVFHAVGSESNKSDDDCLEATDEKNGESTPLKKELLSESESLWKFALVRDYGFEHAPNNSNGNNNNNSGDDQFYHSIRSPEDTNDETPFLRTSDVFKAPTAFSSWKHWRKIDRRIHSTRNPAAFIPRGERVVGPYFLRAASLWKKIEQWCENESSYKSIGREIQSSLLPGRGLDPNLLTSDGGEYDAAISALKAVYSFYSGQDGDSLRLGGLFGGSSAYDYLSCSRFEYPRFENDEFRVIVTKDIYNDGGKVFFMNTVTGQVFVQVGDICRPATPSKAEDAKNCRDSLLRWFEEHANRLAIGYYYVQEYRPSQYPSIRMISQFPTELDPVHCSRAVTNGVEVVASSLFVPGKQFSMAGGIFMYSIRMRLLTSESGEEYISPERRGFETCQLVSRHWRITKRRMVRSREGTSNMGDTTVEEVRGEGVVGEYPLLHEGGYKNYFCPHGPMELARAPSPELYSHGEGEGCFAYQSCTDILTISIEGFLQFVPGSICEPQGNVFDVRVAPFHMDRNPDFFY
mmetsp:Transcript_22141/g.46372  ORF Transcript_22141/g.46372 Transcript_22141/m.46372 type:complete len:563 (-) Transcript_22141:243-1931(-)|eukprot:CAMPEP_0171348638 /NCGR_PEP_ID=MMETSP0878-20121228/31445_1 /TAXON_ID=67004 /ORGANISM="Thalassiosira weissflogii, Strain CCMP1336" /LENGTH=562 /DNA_ID=CAMNT_0011853055 /DNA_START=123 /DNA_END=1811 /DNA_ORIENTATION=+